MRFPLRLAGPALPALAFALTPVGALAAAPQTAPYRELDNVEGDWITLNTVPVRPMALAADGRTLYAVNSHASFVVRFDLPTAQQTASYDVPWGPVSVALWTHPQLGRELLVVACQASHVLVLVDPLTRRTVRLLELPAEPADVIVDGDTDRAFVSCSGADAVLEVRLPSLSIAHVYDETAHPGLRVKHPLFLSFDADGKVLVAPMLSGNDSTSSRLQAGFGRQASGTVLDLTDPDIVPDPATGSLPDEDVFRIDPAARTVEIAATAMGSVLFAHGTHPTTGDLWLLNTEAVNQDPERQSEPAIRGFAIDNRISIATLGASPVEPHTIVNADDAAPGQPGVQYDPAVSVGQPYALTFSDAGFGYVAGLLTDNVTIFDSGGDRVRDWKVTDGAIPRALLFAGGQLVVYCWGNNTLEVWTPLAPAADAILDLGYDPAPELVRAGREVFYDASHSLNGNASCASCHVEGRSDLLAWNLSDDPTDDKGPMLTQTLAGIGKVAPFHWRVDPSPLWSTVPVTVTATQPSIPGQVSLDISFFTNNQNQTIRTRMLVNGVKTGQTYSVPMPRSVPIEQHYSWSPVLSLGTEVITIEVQHDGGQPCFVYGATDEPTVLRLLEQGGVASARVQNTDFVISREDFATRFLTVERENRAKFLNRRNIGMGVPAWEDVDYIFTLSSRYSTGNVNLLDQDVIDGINYMETLGILAPGRAAVILTP